MVFHNELAANAKALTNTRISAPVKRFGKWLKNEERWKPQWEELNTKKRTDEALNATVKKIKNSKGGAGTTDCYEPKHAMKYSKWRAKNPGFLPGWTEALWIKAQMGKHSDIVKKAKSRLKMNLDDGVENYRKFRERTRPLPPINEPTVSQYARVNLGKTKKSLRSVGSRTQSSLEQGRETLPSLKTPAPAELEYLNEVQAPALDENLVKYVFNMSMSNATNDNVARLLKERTAQKFPSLIGAETI